MQARNIPELFLNQANSHLNEVAFEYRLRRNVPFSQLTWSSVIRTINEVCIGLKVLGLEKKDKVAILSATRYEWTITDLAVLSLGGIVVPIYPSLGDEAVNYILNNSESKFIFLEDKGQLQKVRSQWDKLSFIKNTIVFSDLGDLPKYDNRIITFKDLKDKGKLNLSKGPFSLEHSIKDINKTDVASIIYTSGTTGNPKGVIITHDNILNVVDSINKVMPLESSDKFLSFLPLSHVFERVGGMYFALSKAATISYCSNVEHIAQSLKDSNATIMLVVPRLLEKIYSKIKNSIKTKTGAQKKLIDWAFRVGKEFYSEDSKKNASLKSQYFIADKLVFSKIRANLAPKLKYFISGGAPLSREVAEFFYIIGIKILEGYGLTETSAPATVNRLDNFKLGTVGLPLEKVEIKIADDGEILIKGPTVFSAYFKNEEATKNAFVDGWFCTGDIGVIDKDGFLKITDRKKDIIVNSAGKNIAPQNIENSLKMSDFISNAIIIGDKKKFLSALLTLDKDNVVKYVKENDISHSLPLEKNPSVIKLISDEIQIKTARLADYEQIRRFTILPNDFSIETGELTPTLKVKRRFVENKYKDLIDSMYPPE